MSDELIKLDDISDFGNIVPVGKYVGRLTKVEGKESKGNDDGTGKKPMLEVTFEILEGEQQGFDLKMWFPLSITLGKNGKYYARGISELKASCAAVGAPLDASTAFKMNPTLDDATAIAKEFAKRFRPATTPRVMLQVVEEDAVEKDKTTDKWVKKLDADGKIEKRTKTIVIGKATAGKPPAEKEDGGVTVGDKSTNALDLL